MASGTTTILAGVDESPRAADVLALTGTLARALGAGVVVANVRPMVPQPWLPGREALRPQLRDSSERILGEATRSFPDTVAVDTRSVVDGSVPRALTRLADELEAGAVVVAQTQRGKVMRIGGVGERLIHASACAVAVAPPGFAERAPAELDEIVLAFDRSPESYAALGQAVRLAERAPARLCVVGVVDEAAILWGGLATEALITEIRATLADAMRGDVAQALRDAGHPDAELRVFDGDVVAALMKASEDASLLVCGSRGWGPIGAAILGSVSNRLAHSASCPVLAVPLEARDVAGRTRREAAERKPDAAT